ncbi:hypothetical protein BS17DRAFT_777078 [Gyrodon lividus]|nr:hypothetical protein BS17DRAFT_777078 [Gyrodon lividus]
MASMSSRRKLKSGRDELPHFELWTSSAPSMLTIMILSVSITSFCQAVITLRVWYLFYDMLTIKYFAASAFMMSVTASCLLSGFLWKQVREQFLNTGTPVVHPSSQLAWLYVPGLAIHSILLALKIYRFTISSAHMQRNSLLWRLVKEGMFMYAFATGSLLFVVIGLCQTRTSGLTIYWAALASSLPMATAAVAVCRAMLSIQSLTATSHVDIKLLLNHAELSRVHWRRGEYDGVIFVEVNETAIELPDMPIPIPLGTVESSV